MAKQTEQVVSGVSQTAFDAHAHDYRKLMELGVDGAGNYATPERIAIVDDDEVNITDSNKVAAVGITVATLPTTAPV